MRSPCHRATKSDPPSQPRNSWHIAVTYFLNRDERGGDRTLLRVGIGLCGPRMPHPSATGPPILTTCSLCPQVHSALRRRAVWRGVARPTAEIPLQVRAFDKRRITKRLSRGDAKGGSAGRKGLRSGESLRYFLEQRPKPAQPLPTPNPLQAPGPTRPLLAWRGWSRPAPPGQPDLNTQWPADGHSNGPGYLRAHVLRCALPGGAPCPPGVTAGPARSEAASRGEQGVHVADPMPPQRLL